MTNEQAIDLLDNLIGMVTDSNENDYDTALKMGIDAIKEKRTGHWIDTDKKHKIVQCSECGMQDYKFGSYCAYCGAKNGGV